MALGHPLQIVVGSGGVGKTTVAASLAVAAARSGARALVMTFDPSLRLKDALGVGDGARDQEVEVDLEVLGGGTGTGTEGSLAASLLDPGRTFDRLVEQYAPDEAARDRILENRFYAHLSSGLSGVLEYMAVERLFEVQATGRYDRIILDTPPTRQALDFLEAPDRIVTFLDSSFLKVMGRPLFDQDGNFRPTAGLGFFGRKVESYLDRFLGLDLVRDVAEFFQAFGPLYAGFRERAEEVKTLLASDETRFVLVSGPGEERLPDTLFFARRLEEAGYSLGPVVVNRVHPGIEAASATGDVDGPGPVLMRWLAQRDQVGLERLRELLAPDRPVVALPLLPGEPSGITGLTTVADALEEALA